MSVKTRTAALTVLLALLAAAPAGATKSSFSGSCYFSGPIVPKPGITILPHDGAVFDYHATGTCSGSFDGTSAVSAPLSIDFTNTKTFLDTCEVGPDLELEGNMTMVDTTGRTLVTTFSLDMLRAALIAPFRIASTQGGSGLGVAQFMPDNAAAALTDCSPTAAGISHATLKGNYATSEPLVLTVKADHRAKARKKHKRR
jgi:hypothetical protein